MGKVILWQEAIYDLNDIWEYTFRQWSEIQADKYYEAIKIACAEIGENPTIGRSYNEIAPNLLGFKSGSHILFYQQLSVDEVEIIRILHERMDLKARKGGRQQPMVYIPAATSDEAWIQEGKHLEKFQSRGFTNLHTRDRKRADDAVCTEMLQRAKGVFLGGGDQELLAKAYAGTAVHRELVKFLERGGVIMGT